MERQKQNFLNILNAYVNGTDIELEKPDYNEIFHLAKINSLEAVVYSTLKQNKIVLEDTIMSKYENIFNATVVYSVKQEYVANEVIKLMTEHSIRHILFKGIVIKELYPTPELRTMGDIDIIIDSENREKVYELLKNNGFEFDEYSSHSEVLNYKKNGVLFEIHTSLFEKEFFNGINLKEYYKSCFEHAVNINNLTYEFDVNEHFAYIILHMAKHFVDGGCGIRMLLDIVFYIKRHKDMDWEYIRSVLVQFGVWDFTECILSIGIDLFNVKSPVEKVEVNDKIIEYMIDGGVFGYEDKNLDAIRINEGDSSLAGRVIKMLKIIFPSHAELQRRYSWAKSSPKILLPYGWLKMWHFRLFKQKEKSFERVKNAFLNNNDALKHLEMMKSVGLRKD
ncbi:MAG: nucleotidyltransferase family protein [Firmicutes bacterium]|nr:nucleotidyltransferase family protein [Bacillota bacterium]